jgi:hypothetical protein
MSELAAFSPFAILSGRAEVGVRLLSWRIPVHAAIGV